MTWGFSGKNQTPSSPDVSPEVQLLERKRELANARINRKGLANTEYGAAYSRAIRFYQRLPTPELIRGLREIRTEEERYRETVERPDPNVITVGTWMEAANRYDQCRGRIDAIRDLIRRRARLSGRRSEGSGAGTSAGSEP